MGKFNIFKIFARKTKNGINSLISTQTKIENIRDEYNERADKYITSAKSVLARAKSIKANRDKLENDTLAAKKSYESLIDAQKLDEAKCKFITWKGMNAAFKTVDAAWNNTQKNCETVRDTLKNIETNKALLDAKLLALQVQIDTLEQCGSTELGDFGINCEEMIAEVEKEIQNTQFKFEADQEVNDIVNASKRSERIINTACIDTEFEEAVKSYKNK